MKIESLQEVEIEMEGRPAVSKPHNIGIIAIIL